MMSGRSDFVLSLIHILCEILKFNLENEGYEVDTANSAEEALRMDIALLFMYDTDKTLLLSQS